ncbi:unnamed protein product [Cunninghamella blakesleeana]
MRILTWNINGLATTLQYYPWSEKKSYKVLLDTLNADIICFQEIKTQRSKLTREMAIVPGYDGYFSFSKNKHGYSGVSIYVKQPLQPLQVSEKIINDELIQSGFLSHSSFPHDDKKEPITILTQPPELLDKEGRSLIMDFGYFVLFNIYFPNNGIDEDRSQFKMDYHHCVRKRIDLLLDQGKQVILVGDINSVHEEIDHCDPLQSIKENHLSHFKDLPHRQWLDQCISPKGPLIDTCRLSHPNRKGMFTCWNTKMNARPANYGTRIDYILISKGLLPWFQKADIQPEIMGSDHCPVYMDFLDTFEEKEKEEKMDSLKDLLLKQNTPSSSTCTLLTTNFSEFKQNKLSAYFGKKNITTLSSSSSSIIKKEETKEIEKKQSQPFISSSSTIDIEKNPFTLPSAKRKNGASNNQNETKKRQTMTSFFEKVNKSSSSPTSSSPTPSSSSSSSSLVNEKEESDQDDLIDIDKMISQVEERKQVNKVWNHLFQQKAIPKCLVHKENCIELTVNKKGPNQGRRFYLCSKPVGPQNATNNHVDYRCNFFQWKHEKK